jgi:formate hydrogenlyase subunit 6/NADH:ubiquinone oxidoreductase subunit I
MIERDTPKLYEKKEKCCGCSACYAVCPQNAISMVEDEEGFEYPQINEKKCLSCYLCLKVCPLK